MKVVAFLPVKGTSERIKNKNTSLLNGKPLFLHTLEKLMKCDFIDEVYLDTEMDSIYEMAKYTGCKFLKRDPALATNKTDGHTLFYNEAIKVDADIYIQTLCTSPFIKPETIQQGVKILAKRGGGYDSVVLVKREKQYTWDDNGPKYDRNHIPNSVDLPDTIIETMGLYITNRDIAINKHRRYGSNPFLLEASPIESTDVNYPSEFEFAEIISKGLKTIENRKLNFIKKFINSSIISDVLDECNLTNQIITGLKCNLPNAKIFGRARTLKLRKLNDNEDFHGIYDALKSYSEISDNDIIIVENECSDYAYFGELNTKLAIRSGACATIIGGNTRDRDNVIQLDFPVFSKGFNCKDVKGRATLEYFNRTISIDGVSISPSDLIFADNDGIAVIPAQFENMVLDSVINKIAHESNVSNEIIKFKDPTDIVSSVGIF